MYIKSRKSIKIMASAALEKCYIDLYIETVRGQASPALVRGAFNRHTGTPLRGTLFLVYTVGGMVDKIGPSAEKLYIRY